MGTIADILHRRRRELLPFDIPQPPDLPSYASEEPLTPGFAGGPSPASRAYQDYINGRSSHSPGDAGPGSATQPAPTDLPKPSLWRRLLSAGIGGWEGAMRGTPSEIDPRTAETQRQRVLYGNYPERMASRKARLGELESAAQMEASTEDRDLRRRQLQAQIDNYRSLDTYRDSQERYRREQEDRLMKQEEARRGSEQEGRIASAIQRGAVSPSAIPRETVTTPVPDLPQAAQPAPIQVERPGYTRFSLSAPGGKSVELAQPPDALGGSPYVQDRVRVAMDALPETLAAIDSLAINPEDKETLKGIATSAAKSGNNPAAIAQAKVSDLNQRARLGADPAMVAARARVAGATSAASTIGRTRHNFPVVQGQDPETGAPMVWNTATNEVRTAPGGGGGAAEGGMVKSTSPVSAGERQTLANLRVSRERMTEIERTLTEVGKIPGPIMGRLAGVSLQYLGGVAVPQEYKDLITRLQAALTDKAFAEAGKTMTLNEQQRFGWEMPAHTDTLANALTKARAAIQATDRKLQSRLDILDPAQRRRHGGFINTLPSSARPSLPPAGAGTGRGVPSPPPLPGAAAGTTEIWENTPTGPRRIQ